MDVQATVMITNHRRIAHSLEFNKSTEGDEPIENQVASDKPSITQATDHVLTLATPRRPQIWRFSFRLCNLLTALR